MDFVLVEEQLLSSGCEAQLILIMLPWMLGWSEYLWKSSLNHNFYTFNKN